MTKKLTDTKTAPLVFWFWVPSSETPEVGFPQAALFSSREACINDAQEFLETETNSWVHVYSAAVAPNAKVCLRFHEEAL